MWGSLPLKWVLGLPHPDWRWSFGSHDICFKSRYVCVFEKRKNGEYKVHGLTSPLSFVLV